MSNQQTLEEIEKGVKKTIVDLYAPRSTRWNRNHTDVATWYLLWKDEI